MGACSGVTPRSVDLPTSMLVKGKRRALLIGVNYRGTPSELRGCINDALNQKAVLKEHFGFADNDILLLTEDEPRENWPYKARVQEGLKWLYDGAAPGDLLFFHYSGHGSRFVTPDGRFADCICPLDIVDPQRPWLEAVIMDADIHRDLYDSLPQGAKAVAIFDCCHSASIAQLTVMRELDLRAEHAPRARYFPAPPEVALKEVVPVAGFRGGVVSGRCSDQQLWVLCACQDYQSSADAYCDGVHQGAFSWALFKALKQDVWHETYLDLVAQIRANLAGYDQVPALSTTQEAYLNYWYCGREPEVASRDVHVNDAQGGGRRALLIGINYKGTKHELRGCINDVTAHKAMLHRQYKFKEEDMLVLTEDEAKANWPYKARIVSGMKWLVQGAKPGDALFLMYSGHGSRMTDLTDTQPSGMSDCLCPLDCDGPWPEHVILDTEVHQYLYDALPEGVRLTCVFDCCHAGMSGDRSLGVPSVPEKYSKLRYIAPPAEVSKPQAVSLALNPAQRAAKGLRTALADGCAHKNRHVWVFAGCQADEEGHDAYFGDKYQGAFSWAMTRVLENQRFCATYGDLLVRTRSALLGQSSQVPALSTTDRRNFGRYFLGKSCPELRSRGIRGSA